LLSLGLAAIAGSSSAAEETAAKTAKSVALSFAKAIQSGDAAGVQAVVVNGEENKDRISAAVHVLSAMRELHGAALKRFGDEGAALLAGTTDLASDIAAAEPKVEADRAEIAIKGGYPVVLRRIDGRWKVDMQKMLDAAGGSPALALVMQQLAQEIQAGKYKSAQEALEAMSAKLIKAGPDAVGVGDEDQRKAARAVAEQFIKELFKGDAKAATDLCVAAPADDKVIAKLAAMCDSYRKMGEAAVARFDAPGKVFTAESSSLSKQVTEAPITIDADTANVVGMQPPLLLRRVGEKWKVDLNAGNRKREFTKLLASAEPMQAIYDEMAREIKAGKYKSADDAMVAMQDKLTATLEPRRSTSPEPPRRQ
jgi:hypothetical protein